MGGLELGIDNSGISGLETALSTVRENALPAAGAALYARGEAIMLESADNWVPVEWGTLRDTGFVDEPIYESGYVTVRLHYGGGPAAAYAVIQHEDTTLNHPGQGQAKYLEGPVLESLQSFPEDFAMEFGLALGI